MAKKNWKGILFIVMVCCMVLGGCATPPVRPAVSQTVIKIQRHSTRTDARHPMEIYINGVKNDITVANGQSASLVVNDGVHHIQVKVGRNESEILNFTAAQRTVSFVASVEGGPFQRTRVVLSRSEVRDDTGQITDRNIQEQFIPQE